MKKLTAAILVAFMVLSSSFAFANSALELIKNGDGYTIAASHEMKEKHNEMMKKHGDMKHDHDKMKEKHDKMMDKDEHMKHQHDKMKEKHDHKMDDMKKEMKKE